MKRFYINIASNYFSKAFVAIIALIMVPVYIKFLGVEAYGLIGFFTTLMGAFSILDLGLSTTLNREIAQSKALKTAESDICQLSFTLEIVYWAIGVLICLLLVLFAGFISKFWLVAVNVDKETIKRSVMLIGIVIAVQWPISLYHGAMMGLEKQLEFNLITVIIMSIRAIGGVITLKYINNTIEAFFIWQAVINLIYAFTVRHMMWKYLSSEKIPLQFSFQHLKRIKKFAIGLTGASLVTFFLTQADKIFLSKLLVLENYSYYMLGFSIASSLSTFTAPINFAAFPKFSAHYSKKEFESLRNIYHFSSRLTATVIMPVAAILLFFTKEVLLVWLHNPVTVSHITVLTQILILGSLLNTLVMNPYYLTLAFGLVRFNFINNFILAVITFPLLFVLTKMMGANGAAVVWLLINCICVFITVPLMHSFTLKNENLQWFLKDNFIPLLFSFAATGCLFFLYKTAFNNFLFNYFSFFIIALFVSGITFIQVPGIRRQMSRFKFFNIK